MVPPKLLVYAQEINVLLSVPLPLHSISREKTLFHSHLRYSSYSACSPGPNIRQVPVSVSELVM